MLTSDKAGAWSMGFTLIQFYRPIGSDSRPEHLALASSQLHVVRSRKIGLTSLSLIKKYRTTVFLKYMKVKLHRLVKRLAATIRNKTYACGKALMLI